MEEQNSLYELIKSRNGLTVPVINGVHLHSIYNPVKEAEAFAKGYEEVLMSKNSVLILGLGFGYHVEEVAKILSNNHDNYKVIVVEPNTKLVEDFNEKRKFEDANISIINPLDVSELFEDQTFIKFLIHKPCIIKHDASFNLDKKFYTDFLTYNAPSRIEDYLHLIKNDEFKEYLDTYKDSSFDQLINCIVTNGRVNNKNDFAALAFMTMINDMEDAAATRG
jgi:uncharacterized phage-like protein YoqJ